MRLRLIRALYFKVHADLNIVKVYAMVLYLT